MSDFLKQMAKSSVLRASAAKDGIDRAKLDTDVHPLRLGAFDLIAEIKDHSPAEGTLASATLSRANRAREYVAGGAAAISVLTEPSRFAGSLQHLREVVAALEGSGIAVMRKDFLVDPVQIIEARIAGASGVLLIAAMLTDADLQVMLDQAADLGMFVLLECFDEQDLRRTKQLLTRARNFERAATDQLLLGVNTRNLRTLEVDGERLKNLAPLLPEGIRCVAESGLHDAADAARVCALGYRMALVGTALMRSAGPSTLVSNMIASGRQEKNS